MWDIRINAAHAGFLHYACVESSQGRLLVVMSDDGVVDIILGDTLAELLSHAMERFPGAGFIPDRGRHSQWVATAVKRLEVPGQCGAVPIDLTRSYQSRAAG